METLTEFTPIFLVISILGAITARIISKIILEKIQDKKKDQETKKHELCGLVSKFENSLLRIQQHVNDYQNKDIACKDLEVLSISGIVDHQLGHIQRFRSWVNE